MTFGEWLYWRRERRRHRRGKVKQLTVEYVADHDHVVPLDHGMMFVTTGTTVRITFAQVWVTV